MKNKFLLLCSLIFCLSFFISANEPIETDSFFSSKQVLSHPSHIKEQKSQGKGVITFYDDLLTSYKLDRPKELHPEVASDIAPILKIKVQSKDTKQIQLIRNVLKLATELNVPVTFTPKSSQQIQIPSAYLSPSQISFEIKEQKVKESGLSGRIFGSTKTLYQIEVSKKNNSEDRTPLGRVCQSCSKELAEKRLRDLKQNLTNITRQKYKYVSINLYRDSKNILSPFNVVSEVHTIKPNHIFISPVEPPSSSGSVALLNISTFGLDLYSHPNTLGCLESFILDDTRSLVDRPQLDICSHNATLEDLQSYQKKITPIDKWFKYADTEIEIKIDRNSSFSHFSYPSSQLNNGNIIHHKSLPYYFMQKLFQTSEILQFNTFVSVTNAAPREIILGQASPITYPANFVSYIDSLGIQIANAKKRGHCLVVEHLITPIDKENGDVEIKTLPHAPDNPDIKVLVQRVNQLTLPILYTFPCESFSKKTKSH